MKQQIIKFTDTAPPSLIWAKTSSRWGYVLTMTVVESLNSVYAGGHGRDASNAQDARVIFKLNSNTGIPGFAYYTQYPSTSFHQIQYKHDTSANKHVIVFSFARDLNGANYFHGFVRAIVDPATGEVVIPSTTNVQTFIDWNQVSRNMLLPRAFHIMDMNTVYFLYVDLGIQVPLQPYRLYFGIFPLNGGASITQKLLI